LDDALALLRLQLEWGADEAIEHAPVDRLQPPQRQPAQHPINIPNPPKGTPGERALASSAQASTLEELRAALVSFDGCALRETASNLVFAEGSPSSGTLIIGEPPGREEDRSGHAFAGPEGQLLDQMLVSVGLSRSDLMLTPLLPWRPPGGRPPSPAEIAICQPFLHRLIVLLKPHRIILFGGTAARAMLPQAHSRRRGPRAWVEVSIPGMHTSLPAMVLPGLGEMLKNPPLRRDAWAGVRLLRRALDET
jgi:uracil-DNA glycosylase family 4